MPRYMTEDDVFRVLSEYYNHKTYYQHVALAEAIQEVPTADVVERKKGKWIPHNPDEKGFANHFQCSECSVWQKMEVPHKTHDFDFCPNCGAYMREEIDNGRFD